MQAQQSSTAAAVQFIHLRSRNNGIPNEHGGYTVALKARPNNSYSVSICQCNPNQRYNERLGEKNAEARIRHGQFFVQSKEQLTDTMNILHQKLCVGTVPRLNLDVLEETS